MTITEKITLIDKRIAELTAKANDFAKSNDFVSSAKVMETVGDYVNIRTMPDLWETKDGYHWKMSMI